MSASELALIIEGCELVGRQRLTPVAIVPMALKLLTSQSKRIDGLLGKTGELRQALALLEKLAPKADTAADDGSDGDKPSDSPARTQGLVCASWAARLELADHPRGSDGGESRL